MNNIQFNLSLEELKSHDDYLDFFRIKKENTKNVLDLFCGCGGMSLGFQREGFNILAGIDVDNDSLDSLTDNLEFDEDDYKVIDEQFDTDGIDQDMANFAQVALFQSED